MTSDEETNPSAVAIASTTMISPKEGAAYEPPSTPPKVIAVLTGAAKLATSIRGPVSTAEDSNMPQKTDDGDTTMDIEDLFAQPSQYENVPPPSQGSGIDALDDLAAIGLDSIMSETSTTTTTTLSLETTNPQVGDSNSPKYVVNNGEEILVWEEGIIEDAHSVEKQEVVEIAKSSAGKLGEELENALRSLQKRMTKAIAVHKNDDDDKTDSKTVYEKLRNASMKSYNSLVMYGSSKDLSSQIGNDDDTGFLEEGRRSRLLQYGRNLWMGIRNNPELFHDTFASEDKVESDSVAFKRRNDRAIASGYIRALAARLVFLNYIDSRCNTGIPPELGKSLTGHGETPPKSPSLQELEFGLKLFSRAGRAILEHNRHDAQASYDLLSLAVSCFDYISVMADNGSGEAAMRLKDLLDEAFDAVSMLPSAASLFGETNNEKAKDLNVTTWQILVIKSLERAETFVDRYFNVSPTCVLQCALPSLAKICYKHGSHFVKLQEYENAGKALHVALKSTNSCLTRIRQELKQGQSQKSKIKQMLHNLEAELVVVSIEAFYLLNVTYQSTGDKNKALVCLDRIEEYMKEQHVRDLELHSSVITTLSSGEGFVFAEGSANSALEGPRNHFEKDKADIKNRVQTALHDAKCRHSAEKATLAFSRIMTLHRTLPSPSLEEESMIDRKIRDLVDLSLNVTHNHSSVGNKTKGHNEVFSLALHAIRLVYVRSVISKASGAVSGTVFCSDNYKYLFDKLPTSNSRRPFVMIDKLNAMLAIEYQLRERKFDVNASKLLDAEALETAKELLQAIKLFLEKSPSKIHDNDTTLFATSANQAPSHDLLEQAKIHFARAVSLYHASDAHELCVQWSELLQNILQMEHKSSISLADSDMILGQVMIVKAYALSMSGNLDSGRHTAREVWEKIKTVDSMVTLFHCSLRHEVINHSGDTVLEFDAALNELLSQSSGSTVHAIVAAFPRLSNSCAENEGSDLILLRVQERWIDIILDSKPYLHFKESADAAAAPEFTLFDIIRAYLSNFEHVISVDSDLSASVTNFEALERIIDGVLKLLVQLREIRQQKKFGRRKKRKSDETTTAAELDEKTATGFTLVWNDQTVNKLVGDRSDCVWIVEQLWNIGNQLMSASFVTSSTGKLRGVAANVFAASHDFCLMSDEEVGQSLSKGYLDFDVKFDPTKSVLPLFGQTNDRPSCDISSEFSAQCLLVSVATAVDYASDCMTKNMKATSVGTDIQILLGRSLHRLAQAQDEMQLNCEDEKQRIEVNKMIVLLALRCLIGVGEDSLAVESLKGNGLYTALDLIHRNELSASSEKNETMGPENIFVSLRNVKLMADLAEERNMYQTSRCLQRLCAHQLAQADKFVLDLGDYEISLGYIQRKSIQSSLSAKDVLDVYDEIDELVKNHQSNGKRPMDGCFYNVSELTWFSKDANNRAVEHDLLGDYQIAARLFAVALNLLPLCGKEMQCHAKSMNAAYQQITSRMNDRGDSLLSVWSLSSD